MPIYAYKCESCGHRQDVLQKMSDPVLSICPACGASRFAKQLTAAGFQLKGSGWYATDFRGGNVPAAPENSETKSAVGASPAAAPAAATPTAGAGGAAATPAPVSSSAAAADKPRPPKSEAS